MRIASQMVNDKKIIISKELRDFIVPLSGEEFKQLESNILSYGCKDPLVVWIKSNGEQLLIDGHNRYKICQKNDLPFKIKSLSFNSLDEAKLWMVENQMGRRNLSPDQLSYYRGVRYLSLKKAQGGIANVKAKGKKVGSTSEALSEKFNISESTIKRDAKFAEGLNIIGDGNPNMKMKILSGRIKVKKSDVQVLASSKNPSKLKIKNEADLHNKAKLIREEIIEDIDGNLRKIENDRLEKAQQILRVAEPAFLNKEDRLTKIKGKIISSINRAIKKKDVKAIAELKLLVDKLANELF